jgi:putative two-component system response regulator
MSGAVAGPNRRKLILVAEDDASIAALLQRALRSVYDVVTVADGKEAFARCQQQPGPDLVLLDVMMPGMDGFAVAQKLRALPQFKKLPIVFITARDTAMDTIKGIQLGARHYITKPFKIDDVLAKVKKALGS